MTTVHIDLRTPQPDGSLAPAVGHMRFTPTLRRTTLGAVVLPVQFQQKLTDGAADVVLAPTDATWAWRIEEAISGAPSRMIYALVPDVQAISYTDLVLIDKATLAPTAEPDAAWAAMLAETDTRLSAGTITPDPADPGFFLIGA